MKKKDCFPKKKSTYYTEKKFRCIYAFVHPLKKVCFVHHCLDAPRETYRHHTKLRRAFTRRFMLDCQPERPCMHILEELPDSTISQAHKHILAWVRILLENGYTCYNPPGTIEQAQSLKLSTAKLYCERRDMDLSEILCCQNCEVCVYKKEHCKHMNVIDQDLEALREYKEYQKGLDNPSILSHNTIEK